MEHLLDSYDVVLPAEKGRQARRRSRHDEAVVIRAAIS